jgi:toxin ParE1/3/4
MTRRIRVEEAAQDELREAIDWYEHQARGLGTQLHAEIDACMARLREPPDASTPVPRVHARYGLRRVLVKRFPYSIIFLVRDDVVEVIAFAHSSRNPKYWLPRLASR